MEGEGGLFAYFRLEAMGVTRARNPSLPSRPGKQTLHAMYQTATPCATPSPASSGGCTHAIRPHTTRAAFFFFSQSPAHTRPKILPASMHFFFPFFAHLRGAKTSRALAWAGAATLARARTALRAPTLAPTRNLQLTAEQIAAILRPTAGL